MGLSETPQRAEGFEEKLENLQFLKEKMPRKFHEVVGQIKDIAKGYDPDGIHEQFYPGWEKYPDFEDLLKEVGENLD
jgi:hypothetical protein